jgi:predicted enzyme related to lactoylglutathione lyase
MMVTIDCAEPAKLAPFWTEALGAKIVEDMGGEFIIMATPPEGGVLLGLQKVPEHKIGKNRVHVDLNTEDREADVRRLVGMGATVRAEHQGTGYEWTVLADPDGNEFCVGGEVPVET